jgi:hypothetical protein
MARLIPHLLVAGACSVIACSAASDAELDDGSGSSSSSASGSGGGGGLFGTGTSVGAGGSTSGGPSGNCSEAAKLIYVLSDTNELYSFKPDTKQFTLIGPLACPTSMSPNSMAVDRNAVAWVNYVDADVFGESAGALFKVNTADASCESMPTVAMPNGWFRVGMGFSTDGANTNAETLFVTNLGAASAGIGSVDGASVAPIGTFTGAQGGLGAELTGTGDGRLFGFFTSTPVVVGEIDKVTSQVTNPVSLAQVETPTAWAFAFWGGDFYLYTATFGDSRVNRYRPSDGSVDTNYMTNIGFRIVGAGVSTCAPLELPK